MLTFLGIQNNENLIADKATSTPSISRIMIKCSPGTCTGGTLTMSKIMNETKFRFHLHISITTNLQIAYDSKLKSKRTNFIPIIIGMIRI